MWRIGRQILAALAVTAVAACMPPQTGFTCDSDDCVNEQADASLVIEEDAGQLRYCPNENACKKNEACVDFVCVPKPDAGAVTEDAGMMDVDAGVFDAGVAEFDGGENSPATQTDGGITCNVHADCPTGQKCNGHVCK